MASILHKIIENRFRWLGCVLNERGRGSTISKIMYIEKKKRR